MSHSRVPTETDDADDAGTTPVAAARALAATVESTLGPNGMDKMLVGDGSVLVTNDGARVLARLDIDDPTARVLAEAAQSQRRSVGDGTTTTLLLAGELLREADSLLDDGLHPTTVVEGYARAAAAARDHLAEYRTAVDAADTDTLEAAAKTAVTGRWDAESAERFADLTVCALRGVDFDAARLTLAAYPGGDLRASEHVDGLVVDFDTSSTTISTVGTDGPRTVEDAGVALVGAELGVEHPDGVGRVRVDDADQLDALRDHERAARADAVGALEAAGADVVVCQKSIDDEIRTALARAGVLPVERTRQDEFTAVARLTGATPVQSVGELSSETVGRAGFVRRRRVGPGDVLVVGDGPGEPRRSLLLRGGTEHVAEETRHIAETCVSVVRNALRSGVVPGGGAWAMAAARAVESRAAGIDGREQLVARAFADAVERLPARLARNAGRNPLDVLTELRRRHHEGADAAGVAASGSVADAREAGVLDAALVADRALTNAFEAAATVLRIDDVVETTASGGHGNGHDHGGSEGAHGHHDHAHHDTGGYPWALSH